MFKATCQSNIGESAMIINTDEIKNIYVSKKYCDMRKQIAGLSLIVTSEFKMNVHDHSLFIFTHASRNRIMKPMDSGFLPEDWKMENLNLKCMKNLVF